MPAGGARRTFFLCENSRRECLTRLPSSSIRLLLLDLIRLQGPATRRSPRGLIAGYRADPAMQRWMAPSYGWREDSSLGDDSS